MNNRNSYHLENAKILEAPSKEPRTKTSKILYYTMWGVEKLGSQTLTLKALILKAGDDQSQKGPCVPH